MNCTVCIPSNTVPKILKGYDFVLFVNNFYKSTLFSPHCQAKRALLAVRVLIFFIKTMEM